MTPQEHSFPPPTPQPAAPRAWPHFLFLALLLPIPLLRIPSLLRLPAPYAALTVATPRLPPLPPSGCSCRKST